MNHFNIYINLNPKKKKKLINPQIFFLTKIIQPMEKKLEMNQMKTFQNL